MTKIEKVLYTGRTHTTGGRDGAARSDDGALDVRLSPPGSGKGGTNPEQLFAAGWSACFIGALGLAAGKRKIRLPAETAVDAEVDLGMAGEGYFLQARSEHQPAGPRKGRGARAGRRSPPDLPLFQGLAR